MAIRPIWAEYLAVGAAIIVAIWAAVMLGEHSAGITSAPVTVTAAQKAKLAQCRREEAEIEEVGVRVTDRNGSTLAQYDEGEWEDMDQDDKIQQALSIYCAKSPDSGHYTVLIQGRHHSKTLAHVVDGHYSEN